MEKATDVLRPGYGDGITGNYQNINVSQPNGVTSFGPLNTVAYSNPGSGWFACKHYAPTLPLLENFNYTGLSFEIPMKVLDSAVEFRCTLTDTNSGISTVLPSVKLGPCEYNTVTSKTNGIAPDGKLIEIPEQKYYLYKAGGVAETFNLPLSSGLFNRKPPFGTSWLTLILEKIGGTHLVAWVPSIIVNFERPEGEYAGDGVEDLDLAQYLENITIPEGFELMPKSQQQKLPKKGDVTTGWLETTRSVSAIGKFLARDNVFNRLGVPVKFFVNQYRNEVGHTLWITIVEISEEYDIITERCSSSNAKTECEGGYYGRRLNKWTEKLTSNMWIIYDLNDTHDASCELAYYHLNITVLHKASGVLASWARPDRVTRVRPPK